GPHARARQHLRRAPPSRRGALPRRPRGRRRATRAGAGRHAPSGGRPARPSRGGGRERDSRGAHQLLRRRAGVPAEQGRGREPTGPRAEDPSVDDRGDLARPSCRGSARLAGHVAPRGRHDAGGVPAGWPRARRVVGPRDARPRARERLTVCDTLCAIGGGRTLFGKNSDRPVAEEQIGEVHGRRAAGGRLRTQYLEIDDAGAHALFGSRPTWLWGFEAGVNEHAVAIGNEKVWTVDDPHRAEPALIGMDLVRLGLERCATADDAIDVMTSLLSTHGQGGSGEEDPPDPYWSSFLVADARRAWVLETSGRTWAARPVEDGAAISNRITLGTAWTRASGAAPAGADFDRWRTPRTPTGIADHRLGATRQCVATGGAALTAADVVATLRHHGERPWGAPGGDP